MMLWIAPIYIVSQYLNIVADNESIDLVRSYLPEEEKYQVTHSTISLMSQVVTETILMCIAKYFERIRVIDLIISNWAIKIKEDQINKLFTI